MREEADRTPRHYYSKGLLIHFKRFIQLQLCFFKLLRPAYTLDQEPGVAIHYI